MVDAENDSIEARPSRVGVYLPKPKQASMESEFSSETFTFVVTVSRTFRDFGKSCEVTVANQRYDGSIKIPAPT